MWFVYIVECRDKTLYTGITNNLEKRIQQHNNGSGAKYTSGRRPVTLINHLQVDTRSTALKIEHQIKRTPKKKKCDKLTSLK